MGEFPEKSGPDQDKRPGGKGHAASAHLTEWDEEHTVWAEESEDEAEKQQPGTYRPFENLKEMLEKGENL